jgi:RNA polymerase primary sigma factor
MNSINVKLNNNTIQSNSLRIFMNEASKYKPLSPEQEKTATVEQLVKHNMLFAVSVAKRHTCDSIDVMDLLSEALMALDIAAKKFEPDRGYKFISYAVFWMRQRVSSYINKHKGNVRYPETISSARFSIEKHGLHDLDVDEISQKIKIPVNYVQTAMNMKHQVSLSEVDHDGDLIYQLASDSIADENLMQSYNMPLLLKNLSDIEKTVIQHRHLNDCRYKLEDIAEKYNYSRERIRQIEKAALKKIKHNYETYIR